MYVDAELEQMREVTNVIVRDARDELKGGEDSTLEEWLRRSWVAWKLANLEEDNIGGKSFWWALVLHTNS
jgi:RNA-dependent RNA polymerase